MCRVGYEEIACLDDACIAHEKASGEFAFPEPRLKPVNAEFTEVSKFEVRYKGFRVKEN